MRLKRPVERAGVPRSVAMQMVGHKAEAIYSRYVIVNDAGVDAAADNLPALHGHSGPFLTVGKVG